MKKLCFIWVLLLASLQTVHARDFIVEFLEENYKETQARFSYDPLIYHSIQVNSSIGPKVLILTGDDYNYRKWLRQYIARDKKFITRIAEDRINEFISSKAYEIDVSLLHPFNPDKWDEDRAVTEKKSAVTGIKNILLVDPNEKRTDLILTVIKKMGYGTAVYASARKALDAFRLEPEKFRMVLVHHDIRDLTAENFVEQIVKTDNNMPVVVDTGYKNQHVKNRLSSRFSKVQSVHLKPVMLRELPKTIEQLMKKSV